MRLTLSISVLWLALSCATPGSAQTLPKSPPRLPVSKVQPVLDAASAEEKYTFIVFSRGDSPALRTMLSTVKAWVEAHAEQATFVTADGNSAAEQPLVERLGFGRAPMPLTVVVAPNGAMTGIFSKSISDQQLSEAIVTPTMMRCMKALQEQKLVFICLTQDSDPERAAIPAGVQSLQEDPNFAERIELVSMSVNDPAEGRLIAQMQIQPKKVTGAYAVCMAPPGVLIGHYGSKSTAEQIAAAIHEAGKCCDDPNCKHNKASKAAPSAQKSAPRRK